MSVRAARYGVSAVFFLCGALFGMWASRIPDIKTNFGLDEASLGALLLVLALGSFTAFPLSGYLIDRIGAALVSKILTIATLLVFVSIGLAPTIPFLALCLALAGFSIGGLDVAMNAWGAEVETRLARPVMSSYHGMFSLGAGVGAQVGGVAIWGGVSVVAHFALWGAIFIPVVFWICRLSWESDTVSRTGERAPFLALPKGGLALVGVVALIAALGEGAVTDWAALYQIQDLGYPDYLAPTAFAIFSFAMVVMRFAGDRIIAAHGPVKVARVSGAAALFGGLLFVSGWSLWVVWAGCFVMGLGYAVLFPLAMSRAASDPHMSKGRALAAVATLGYGAFLLGPPLLGFVGDLVSLRASLLIVVLFTTALPFLAGALKTRTG